MCELSLVSYLFTYLYVLFLIFLATCHETFGILVPWPGIEPTMPALEVQTPKCWTTREVPGLTSYRDLRGHINRIGLPLVLVAKNSPANAGLIRDVCLNPGSGRSPGGGHGNPLQSSRLENPMDRVAWRAMVHKVSKSRTQTEAT